MKNQNFNLWRNLMNSFRGIAEVFKNETAFKIEIISMAVLFPAVFFFPVTAVSKAVLLASLFVLPMVEIMNSAVERNVDLVTEDYHELAKHAKDAASGAVLFAIVFTAFVWIAVFYLEFIA